MQISTSKVTVRASLRRQPFHQQTDQQSHLLLMRHRSNRKPQLMHLDLDRLERGLHGEGLLAQLSPPTKAST
jgi:hypothetical protein